jgi:ATP-dependent DNA helicase RecG
MIQWSDPISFIHGLTAQQRRVLKTLEVETIGDLLNIFPRRYDDYSRIVRICDLPNGTPVTIRAAIEEIKEQKTFRRNFKIIRATVSDGTGSIAVTWFNQPWLLKTLKPGDEIYISGAVTMRPRMGRGFTSPLWEPATAETIAAGMVAPVYPLSGSLTQKTLRKVMKAAVEDVDFPEEWLPREIAERVHVPPLGGAYHLVHRPQTSAEAEQGRRRFAFGELLTYQLALRMARTDADIHGAPPISFSETFAKSFVSGLPFSLTDDQKKSVWAAVNDMTELSSAIDENKASLARPMRRLIQGDVGSGKTVVAAMLAAIVFRSGHSAALMAPTDLLAKQHAETLYRFLAPHQIPVMLYTSSSRMMMDEKKPMSPDVARARIAEGRMVIVGTHALLERGQSPPDVALVVVDEQHRFGVAQRETLVVSTRSDGKVPHLLSMSATPIPRSLALTLLGDLDVSVIHAKPAGRLPIETTVMMGDSGREIAYDRIREEVARGHRAFIVCPLIDDSDTLGVKSVEAEARRLQNGPLRMLKIGVVHGKMPAKEKDEHMQKFVSGAFDVLIATTVVEVGVDVPEATVMCIEGAERFGLAQLHQLRGRVGRSSHQSYCLLIASDEAFSLERLRVLERTNDGFEVAEADLRLRGEGNLLGMQQSGQAIFKSARMDDLELMASAREISQEITDLSRYPALEQIVMKLRQTSHQE